MKKLIFGLGILLGILLLFVNTSKAEGIVTYSDNEEYTGIVNGVYYSLSECFQVCSEVQLTDADYLTMWYSSLEKKSQNYGFTTSVGANNIYGEMRGNGLVVLSTNVDKNVLVFTLYHEIGHILDSGQSNYLTSEDVSIMSELAAISPVNNSQHITTASEAFAESFAWYIWQPSILQVNAENLYNMWYEYENNYSENIEEAQVMAVTEIIIEGVEDVAEVETEIVEIVEETDDSVKEGDSDVTDFTASTEYNIDVALNGNPISVITLNEEQMVYMNEDGYFEVEVEVGRVEDGNTFLVTQGEFEDIVEINDGKVDVELHGTLPVVITALSNETEKVIESEELAVDEVVPREFTTAGIIVNYKYVHLLVLFIGLLCLIEITIMVSRDESVYGW